MAKYSKTSSSSKKVQSVAIMSSRGNMDSTTGEILLVNQEAGSASSLTDQTRAVALLNVGGSVVGHVPREFSRVFWHFLACAKQIIPTTEKEACA